MGGILPAVDYFAENMQRLGGHCRRRVNLAGVAENCRRQAVAAAKSADCNHQSHRIFLAVFSRSRQRLVRVSRVADCVVSADRSVG